IGDLVLDPFGGTFTTSAVANKLGRKSISIELQEDYLKIGLRRLNISNEYNGVELKPILKFTQIKNDKKILTNITQELLWQ
ncbi:MAG: adenine-specific DNA-methyltransferase, partial [Burkholderiales bacterium]|nr:adenine-specific DNA-methyltransferase [Burkholderiales bacterium]